MGFAVCLLCRREGDFALEILLVRLEEVGRGGMKAEGILGYEKVVVEEGMGFGMHVKEISLKSSER